ncbi:MULTISPECIES: response regulator [unclassified Pseudomonas]|uniref:response regulator n=1 Tax=unclassified Pseudomonas TaxID=196821 RepID=UPI0024489479|nr:MULTISPECIES: response regulator [unclassified Pseudomonas]MDG9924442.1 response regulator [Pseudomonas sp. GD04045]MDH0035218.1 response regulator [Pseudomonas sp. GD04019]
MAQVLVADEQPLIRRALQALLEQEGHLLIGECADGGEALQLVRRLQPDMLVLELSLQRLGGLEVIRRLRQSGSSLPVLVYSAQDSPHHAALSLQAGATGFVGKQESPQAVLAAMRGLLQGRSHFPAQALGTVAAGELLRDEADQLRSLSPRELTVLRYLANGASNKRIADELALSDRTVSTYKVRLLHKLNVGSLAELLELAWRNGLLGHLPQATSEAAGSDRFHQLFDSLPMPVCLRDPDGRLQACNQQFLDFYGLEREALLGRRVAELVELDEDEVRRYREIYRQAVERGEPYSCEVLLAHHGQQRSLRHWGVPWRDENGALVGMLCSAVDLSEQQREIAELAQAKARGETRQRLRAQFLQAAGQDLLAQVRELRRLLTQAAGPAEAVAASLEEQLQVLLDLVRLERGDLVLEPQRADLAQLTAELATAVPCELPASALARVDVRRYEQIVVPLLGQCAEAARLQARMTILGHGEADWHLRLQPCAQPVGYSAPLLLAARLATLMGGELSWSGDAALLRLRLLQAL